MHRFLALVSCTVILSACSGSGSKESAGNDQGNEMVPLIGYTVQKVYPHDTSSYTQGLEWHDSILYEGTGREGYSELFKVQLATGKKENQVKDVSTEFGEGITILNNKIYQLTWKGNKVHVYDLQTFKKIKDENWPFEGWGLTNNGKQLIVSTGSNTLYFVDPETFKIINQVGVFDNYGPVSNLNELEYVNGSVYANQYLTNYILKINANTGKVDGKVDCTDILSKSGITYNPLNYDINSGNVLNGIAYQPSSRTFFITGKLWPALFQVKFN